VETRMRGFGAEVDRAICPSTVTNSGPLRKPADKHSIYTLARPVVQVSKLWFEWQSRELPEAVSTRFMVC